MQGCLNATIPCLCCCTCTCGLLFFYKNYWVQVLSRTERIYHSLNLTIDVISLINYLSPTMIQCAQCFTQSLYFNNIISFTSKKLKTLCVCEPLALCVYQMRLFITNYCKKIHILKCTNMLPLITTFWLLYQLCTCVLYLYIFWLLQKPESTISKCLHQSIVIDAHIQKEHSCLYNVTSCSHQNLTAKEHMTQ